MPLPLCIALWPSALSALLTLAAGAPAVCAEQSTECLATRDAGALVVAPLALAPAPIPSGGSVIWFGPVNGRQSGQAEAHYVRCTGDGHPSCRARAEAHGNRLDRLATELRLDQDEPLVLRAFSAGGSAVKRYLEVDGSRARVRVVTLADGAYETTPGAVAPGFVQYALDCLDGGRLFVATASAAPNLVGGEHAMTGAASLAALRAEIERRSGRTFEPVRVPGLDVEGLRLGGIYFFDFGHALSHEEHATLLAPRVWQGLVAPFLAGRLSPASRPVRRP